MSHALLFFRLPDGEAILGEWEAWSKKDAAFMLDCLPRVNCKVSGAGTQFFKMEFMLCGTCGTHCVAGIFYVLNRA